MLFANSIFAKCNIAAVGEVNILSHSFPVLEVISDFFKDCNSSSLKIIHQLNNNHKDELLAIFSANKAPYELVQLSTSTIAPLQAAGLLLPLNALVAKYRVKYNIEDNMLIKIDGKIVAIAFLVNVQHLFYREDLLEKNNIAIPQTYAELLAAAKKLKKTRAIKFPLSGTYQSGWNLAQEFINIFLSYGGQFFHPITGKPTFDSIVGQKTLVLMKQLMSYMPPDALSFNSTLVAQQFQKGQVAMANLWASRALSVGQSAESKVTDKVNFASAPKVRKGARAAATLWWHGFSIPKNASGDSEVAFQVMMEGLSEAVVAANNDIAIWLRSNHTPSRFSKGAIASVQNKAVAYPMTSQIHLVHTALGNNIGDYLAGKESAKESLQNAIIEYEAAVKNESYIQQ